MASEKRRVQPSVNQAEPIPEAPSALPAPEAATHSDTPPAPIGSTEKFANVAPGQMLILKRKCGGAPNGAEVGDVLGTITLLPGVSMHFIADGFRDGFVDVK